MGLLGTPFALNMNTFDVGQFLYFKIYRKLEYLETYPGMQKWSFAILLCSPPCSFLYICYLNQKCRDTLVRFLGKLEAQFATSFGGAKSNSLAVG